LGENRIFSFPETYALFLCYYNLEWFFAIKICIFSQNIEPCRWAPKSRLLGQLWGAVFGEKGKYFDLL